MNIRKLSGKRRSQARRGAAAVELAILLPILVFLFLVGVDYARIFYSALIVTNCSRNAALYSCDKVAAKESPYKDADEAGKADGANLKDQPTVATAKQTAGDGNAMWAATVESTFRTVTNYPGIPSKVDLKETTYMREIPTLPKFD